MRRALVFLFVVTLASPVWGQGGFIGVYSDDTGSGCNLVDNTTGTCSYYVVHTLAPATSGSRFKVVSQHAGIPLGDTPVFFTTGTSQAGVSIDYGGCMDASAGLHILTLNYYCQGTTPACATFEVVPGPDGLEALDCEFPAQWMPANGWTSYINDDGSCPCDLPGNPEIGVLPSTLDETLCSTEMTTQTLTISNTGAIDLDFELAVTEVGGVVPQPSVLYFTDITPDTLRVGERALQNLGISRTLMTDYGAFLVSLGNGGWDLVIFEPSSSSQLSPSPASTFADHIAAGGAIITSNYYDDELGRIMQALRVGYTIADVFQWTTHRVFSVPNAVPDSIQWAGGTYMPAVGGAALAGYAAIPDPLQAAIVAGNHDRTILNAMKFSSYLASDANADGKDDIVALVENEIRFMLEPWAVVMTEAGTVPPDSSVDVDVVLNPPRWLLPGAHNAEVRITCNDPVQPEVVIPAQLDVLDPGFPLVSPSALADTIYQGDTSSQMLMLVNNGPCTVDHGIAVKHVPSGPLAKRWGAPGARRASVEAAVSSMRRRSGILEGPLRKKAARFLSGETVDVTVDRPAQVVETLYPTNTVPGPHVAILAGGDAGDVSYRLAETLKFQSVTYIDVTFVTPTLGELQAFDGVVVWWDYPYLDRVTLGNNLADYVDGGGGVLLAVPETAGESASYLGGRWETEDYFIIDRSDYQVGQATLGTILKPAHPIMAGVDSLDGGAFSFRPSVADLTAGGTMVATWSDGMPLVATRVENDVRRADLGYFLHSGTYGWRADTDGGVLMANALEWVAGYGEEWLSLSVSSGSLLPSSGAGIDVGFDAMYLDPGSYQAEIIVGDNDPATPDVVVPVTLQVDEIVAVFITDFTARALETGVELRWDIFSDEDIRGFRIYRSAGNNGHSELLNTERLIPPPARAYVDHGVEPGNTYRYTLGVVREDGTEMLSQAAVVSARSYALELHQNYPNPFNPTTTISFTLPQQTPVNLTLYALDGTRVRTLIDAVLPAGSRKARWDGTDDRGNAVSSGVYFYRLTAGKRSLAKKMVYLK